VERRLALDMGLDAAEMVRAQRVHRPFQEEIGDFSTKHIDWQITHLQECTADPGSYGCPPEPEGPVTPTLEDYKTGEAEACSIGEVLRHRCVERLSMKIVVQRPFYAGSLVVPEQEPRKAERDSD
jgi:hypothetical protein